MKKDKKSSIGQNWVDFEKKLKLTPKMEAEIKAEMDIIDQIIEAREAANLTQHQLSDITGISQPASARIERKNVKPTIETVTKLVKPLNLKIALKP